MLNIHNSTPDAIKVNGVEIAPKKNITIQEEHRNTVIDEVQSKYVSKFYILGETINITDVKKAKNNNSDNLGGEDKKDKENITTKEDFLNFLNNVPNSQKTDIFKEATKRNLNTLEDENLKTDLCALYEDLTQDEDIKKKDIISALAKKLEE